MRGAVFPNGGQAAPSFFAHFLGKTVSGRSEMKKETIAEHLKRYHCGGRNAVTSQELETAFDIRGKE